MPRAEKCLSDFWQQMKFGWRGSLGSWGRQEYSLVEHVSLSSGGDLHSIFSFFKHRCIGVKCQCESSFFLSPRLLTAEKSKLPFYLTLPQPPLELRGCVCVCADMLSPSVFLCHIKLVRGWERGCKELLISGQLNIQCVRLPCIDLRLLTYLRRRMEAADRYQSI